MPRRKRYKANDITVDVPTDLLPEIAKAIAREGPKAVRTSAQAVAAYAKSLAPRRFGKLQEGIIVPAAPEKSSLFGKYTFGVYMDAAMNEIFVKMAGKKRDGSKKRYYYPASQEYGFLKRNGRDRVPGKYFLKTASAVNSQAHEQRINQAIDNIIKEAAKDV